MDPDLLSQKGDLVSDAKVLRIDRGRGLLLELPVELAETDGKENVVSASSSSPSDLKKG